MHFHISLWGCIFLILSIFVHSRNQGVPRTSSVPRSHAQNTRSALSGISGIGLAVFASQVAPKYRQQAYAAPIPHNLPIKINKAQVSAAEAASTATSGASEGGFVSGLASGAVSRINKELLLHPIDTVRARLQMSECMRNVTNQGVRKTGNEGDVAVGTSLYSNLYDGIVPAIVGGVPAGALFFGVKDASKKALREMGLDRASASAVSVLITNVPYWVVRSPAEMVKTRRQAGVDESSWGLVQALWGQGGVAGGKRVLSGLYSGYASNYVYACPADVVKFLAYEAVTSTVYGLKEGQKVKGVDAAVSGAIAGLASQVCTTPLDVARTRIMTDTIKGAAEGAVDNFSNKGSLQVMVDVWQQEGPQALFSGITPRVTRAVASGIIQFVSVEYVNNIFRGR